MIKVSVLYPFSPKSHFDHDYYREKHMPMLKQKMGEYCLYYSIDKGLSAPVAEGPPTYLAMCHIICKSMEDFLAGIEPHAKEIMADVANYTDVEPIQIFSEVVVEHSNR
jgi:uncharacterized protein (TIGR02118 family)